MLGMLRLSEKTDRSSLESLTFCIRNSYCEMRLKNPPVLNSKACPFADMLSPCPDQRNRFPA